MLGLPGKMEVTLVSFYGEKPSEVTQLMIYLQDLLASALSAGFRPYQLEQVHGTIVGLEGRRSGTTILNSVSGLPVDPSDLLSFLRNSEFPSIRVRVDGYRHHEQFPLACPR